MTIKINDQEVAVKKDTSFEYISTNRLFTDADDFTMELELPLKDCPQNTKVFGHLNIRAIQIPDINLSCELIAGRFHRTGRAVITQVSDISVNVQLLFGQTATLSNSSLENIYINELAIGYNTKTWTDAGVVHTASIDASQYPCSEMMKSIDDGLEWLALTWVEKNTSTKYNYAYRQTQHWRDDFLSFSIYMVKLAERIATAIGLTYNFSAWYASDFRYLVCLNALPTSYIAQKKEGIRSYTDGITDYARMLPHWTVAEFFDQVHLLTGLEFDFDFVRHSVAARSSVVMEDEAGVIRPDKVVDKYTTEQQATSDNKFLGIVGYQYADRGDEAWPEMTCSWIKKYFDGTSTAYGNREIVEVQTAALMLSVVPKFETVSVRTPQEPHRQCEFQLFHIVDTDRYFIAKQTYLEDLSPDVEAGMKQWKIGIDLYQVMCFGPTKSDDSEMVEIKILPGVLIPSDTDEDNLIYELEIDEQETDAKNMTVTGMIEEGERGVKEYNSKLYVGFWKGLTTWTNELYPFVNRQELRYRESSIDVSGYSLAPRKNPIDLEMGAKGSAAVVSKFTIDPRYLYHISFLSSDIPNVRGVYEFDGKRYLCQRLTARFTNEGMSQLIEGEFFPIID